MSDDQIGCKSSQYLDGKLYKVIFSTDTMIEMVRDQPCLWNKTLPDYRDNSARLKAWEEVYRQLEPGYDDMKPTLQTKIGQHIRKKWFNIRDAYLKSLKDRHLVNNRKPYVHSKRISFLDPFLSRDKVDDTIYFEEEDYSEEEIEETELNEPTFVYVDDLEIPNKRAKLDYNIKKEPDLEEPLELSAIDDKRDDTDKAFFTSIVPVVKTLSVDAKLEFQIQVLNVLKDIKKRDKRGEFQ